ncbi:MAG: NfeD family protein [Pseudomonadota bacterium]
MISDLISELGPWAWLALGLLLLVAEVLAPGIYLLFFGLAAMVVGIISVFAGDSVPWWTWHGQMILFGVLSAAFVIYGHRWVKSRDQTSDQPHLNDRQGAMVGRTATLADPIENGVGKIKLGDTVWRVTGPDLAAGKKVVVEANENGVLRVAST